MKNMLFKQAIVIFIASSNLLFEIGIAGAYAMDFEENKSNTEATQIANNTVCEVTDPTGTPLNVRAQPNGEIINTLKNGREVYIDEIAYDSQGRPWAKVSGYYQGEYRYWGWIYREFVSCYNR